MKPKSLLPIILTASLLFAGGCGGPPPAKELTLDETEKAFIKYCKKEFNITVITQMLDKTIWIYAPFDKDLLTTSVQDKLPREKPKDQKLKPYALLYVDGKFENRTFTFEYDVIPPTKTGLGSGIDHPKTDDFNTINRRLYAAISKHFFPLSPEEVPEFFVVVRTDIKNGVEIKTMFYLTDYKRLSDGGMPHEEYDKRQMHKLRGAKEIIDDKEGRHLEWEEITWGQFLTAQTINRVNYKYKKSDFPPERDPEDEILTCAANAIFAYGFKDFDTVVLKNLRTEDTYRYTPNQVEAFYEK